MVDGRLGAEVDASDDPGDGGSLVLLINCGPRQARTDEKTVAAIAETVSEFVSQPAFLEEFGIPVRSQEAARVV